MSRLAQIKFLFGITRSQGIARRYFVVNGFDGALTMLGIIAGFHFSGEAELHLVIRTCLSAAIALGMSGMTSAYVSEVAERKRALRELADAMVTDLTNTTHGEAARLVPWLIGAVNGLAPLLIALLIIAPLWFSLRGVPLPLDPLPCAMALGLGVIFLLGVFLGRVSGTFWLRSGLQTLAVALLTAGLIFFISR